MKIKSVTIFLLSLLLSFILYVLWIQISVGNIWWRSNTFQPHQILTFFEKPFYKYGHMWDIEILDINPYIFIPFVTLLLYFVIKIVIN